MRNAVASVPCLHFTSLLYWTIADWPQNSIHFLLYHVRFVTGSSVSWLQAGHSLSHLFITVAQSGLSVLQLINDSSWPLKAFRRTIIQFWAGIQTGTQKYQASIFASIHSDNFLLCYIALQLSFTGSPLFGCLLGFIWTEATWIQLRLRWSRVRFTPVCNHQSWKFPMIKCFHSKT